MHWISNLFLGEKTVRPAEGGTPNSLGKMGGNQWDALRASHALGASVSFSTKLEPPLGLEPRTLALQKRRSTTELRRHYCAPILHRSFEVQAVVRNPTACPSEAQMQFERRRELPRQNQLPVHNNQFTIKTQWLSFKTLMIGNSMKIACPPKLQRRREN